MQLLSNQTANGSSDWVDGVPDINGGRMNVYVAGNLGAGTLTIESLAPDGASAVPVENGAFSSAEMRSISIASAKIRATLAGSITPSVSVWVEIESVDLRHAVRNRI